MRLIDADATFNLLKSLGNRGYRREKGTIADAMKMISYEEYTPTIDAVPVVRCEKCVYRKADIMSDDISICTKFNTVHKNDFWCKDGERINDGN